MLYYICFSLRGLYLSSKTYRGDPVVLQREVAKERGSLGSIQLQRLVKQHMSCGKESNLFVACTPRHQKATQLTAAVVV